MTEYLKPCPFCGGEAKMLGEYDGMYQAVCPNCAAKIDNYDDEKEVASEKWNKRKIEEKLIKKIDKLKTENEILRLYLSEIAVGVGGDGLEYTREGMMGMAKEALKGEEE